MIVCADNLQQLYSDLEPIRHVSQLPNFAFSLPLCRRRLILASSTSREEAASEKLRADSELRDALLRFPNLLFQLLDKCGVQPDADVQCAPLFNETQMSLMLICSAPL